MSFNPIITEEAINEAKTLRGKKTAVIGLGGKMIYDVGTDMVVRALHGMVKPVNPAHQQRSKRGI